MSHPARTNASAKRGPRGIRRDRQILDAAKKLFHERGFDAVGVDEIGRAAGLAGPSIYAHFSGKQEILMTLFDEAADRLLADLGPALPDPVEEIRRLAHVHATFVIQDRALTGVFAREGRALKGNYRRRMLRRQNEWSERWMQALTRAFPTHTEEILTMVRISIGELLNSISRWPRGLIARDDAAEVVCNLVADGLRSLTD